jgi:hypothetical protein
MKALRALLSLAVLCSIIAFSGCGGGKGNPEPLADKQFGLLSKVWKLKDVIGNSVFLGSADSTKNWTNFKLTVSGTKGSASSYAYSCSGRPPRSVWPPSGSWQFGDCDASTTTDDPATQICRDDGAKITYSVDATGQNLQLKFTFNGTGYTRLSNVSGDWTFNLVPN